MLIAPQRSNAGIVSGSKADVVLFAVYWGKNLPKRPEADEIAAGHALIDAGADAVLGSSAHNLQGIEIYRDRPILHDAGNLLFEQRDRSVSDTAVFLLSLSRDGVRRVEAVPVASGYGESWEPEGEEAQRAAGRFTQLCAEMGTTARIDGRGRTVIELEPPPRPGLPDDLGRDREEVTLSADRLGDWDRLPDPWTPPEVPAEARIEPVRIGPLDLIGLRVFPTDIPTRQMLWVETFWTAPTEIDGDHLLDIRAIPQEATDMPAWGLGMFHDPCDWLAPTSSWSPGRIYRDFYGLRPPPLRALRNVPLRVEIGVIAPDGRRSSHLTDRTVTLSLEGKDQAALPVPAPPKLAARPRQQNAVTWTAEELTAVTGGRWLTPPPAHWHAGTIHIGAKSLDPSGSGQFFAAHTHEDRHRLEAFTTPRRETYDFHKRLASLAPSLCGAMVQRPVEGMPADFPLLLVKDALGATMELGFAARDRFDGPVFAVTGTVGKSSARDMIQALLGLARTLVTGGNFNTRVGVPVTLANLGPSHAAAVIEVAQSALWMRAGPVTRRLRPTVALITEIGYSQSSRGRGTLEEIADWKSRIFDGLVPGGVAVFGDHLPHLDLVLAKARRHAGRVFRYGTGPDVDLRVRDILRSPQSSTVEFEYEGRVHRLDVPVPGAGMARNALGAVASVIAAGFSPAEVIDRMRLFASGEARLQTTSHKLGEGRFVLIDDSWNAEVASMLNAFDVLSQYSGASRRIAILGRIVHLGDKAKELHESLAAPLQATAPSLVLTHGAEMLHLREKLPDALLGRHFSRAEDVDLYLSALLGDGDVVMIKGSRRDSDFGEIGERLRKRFDPA